jgi:hypothetical protein
LLGAFPEQDPLFHMEFSQMKQNGALSLMPQLEHFLEQSAIIVVAKAAMIRIVIEILFIFYF